MRHAVDKALQHVKIISLAEGDSNYSVVGGVDRLKKATPATEAFFTFLNGFLQRSVAHVLRP